MGEGWRLEREGREEPTDKLGEVLFEEADVGRILGPKEVEWGEGGREREREKETE